MPLSAPARAGSTDEPSFDDTGYDELRDEAVRRFEALVDRVTARLENEPTLDGSTPEHEASRLAAIALLAQVTTRTP